MRILRMDGSTDYYKRDGDSNTFNGDPDLLQFNLNNTGLCYDFLGNTYTTTWHFTDPGKTKMTLVINKPSPLTLTLENIALTKSYFSYSQVGTDRIYYLASARRTPN
jgi:hypothetical protein